MIRTNIALLGLLALGCSTGCAATVQPSGTVYTTYSPAVVVDEPVVVRESVVAVENPVTVPLFPLFPLLVSHHHSSPHPVVHHHHHAPAPRVHHATPLRQVQPPRQTHGVHQSHQPSHSPKAGHGGGKPSKGGGRK
ncbi:MAG: hypothetical protein J6U96_02200 [Elusimicrobiaceae bacterium]|nr:hypothetical protein [Elusimicrobiaceae bacterium]